MVFTPPFLGPSFSRHSLVNLKLQPSQAKLLLRFAPRYRGTETLQADGFVLDADAMSRQNDKKGTKTIGFGTELGGIDAFVLEIWANMRKFVDYRQLQLIYK